MKANFIISGKLLDDQERGIEGSVTVAGIENETYFNPSQISPGFKPGISAQEGAAGFSPRSSTIKKDGVFVLTIMKFSLSDLVFKRYLDIAVKIGEMTYEFKMSYPFCIRPNQHLKLKIYPFSNRVIEIK